MSIPKLKAWKATVVCCLLGKEEVRGHQQKECAEEKEGWWSLPREI